MRLLVAFELTQLPPAMRNPQETIPRISFGRDLSGNGGKESDSQMLRLEIINLIISPEIPE